MEVSSQRSANSVEMQHEGGEETSGSSSQTLTGSSITAARVSGSKWRVGGGTQGGERRREGGEAEL